MGRTKRDISSPSATALLDAAARILSKRSAIDISLSDLAAESGLNSALVKYYFGSKDGLLLALMERASSAAVDEVRRLASSDLPPEDKLKAHIAGAIGTYFRAPYLNRLFHYLIDSGSAEVQRDISERFGRPVMEAHRAILAEGVALGRFRAVDPEMFYFSVTGACDFVFSSAGSLPALAGEPGVTDALRRRYVAHVTDLFLAALAPRG